MNPFSEEEEDHVDGRTMGNSTRPNEEFTIRRAQTDFILVVAAKEDLS